MWKRGKGRFLGGSDVGRDGIVPYGRGQTRLGGRSDLFEVDVFAFRVRKTGL